jgi:hypothetical protein
VHVDHVLARDDAADRYRLLIERVDDRLAADPKDVVDAAEVVPVEVHQAGFPGAEPDKVLGRVLDVEIDVGFRSVGPGQRDQEFGLGIDGADLAVGLIRR